MSNDETDSSVHNLGIISYPVYTFVQSQHLATLHVFEAALVDLTVSDVRNRLVS